jgi:hypothetical protein
MGYEIRKGQYVKLTEDELEAVAIEGTHTIEIDQFVPRNEIDDLYLNHPYYLTPDGKIGEQAYAVIREAIKKEGMVALGRAILTTREHVIAIEPRGKGLLGITLRYPYEIRKEEDYFGGLPDEKVPKEIAANIVATKAGHFRPEKFEDSLRARSAGTDQEEATRGEDRETEGAALRNGNQSDGGVAQERGSRAWCLSTASSASRCRAQAGIRQAVTGAGPEGGLMGPSGEQRKRQDDRLCPAFGKVRTRAVAFQTWACARRGAFFRLPLSISFRLRPVRTE